MPKYIYNQAKGSINEQSSMIYPNADDYQPLGDGLIYADNNKAYTLAIGSYFDHIDSLKKHPCSEALKQELKVKQKAGKEVLEGYDFYVIIGGKAVTMEEYQKTIEFQQSEGRLHRQGQIKLVIHQIFEVSEKEAVGAIQVEKPTGPFDIDYSQKVLPLSIQIDPGLMRDEQAEVRAISYARLLGEFTGFLQGFLNYDAIPANVKENILKKITELDAITSEQVMNYDRNYIISLEERIEQFEQDQRDAAGELLIEVPEPGTDMAKVMVANAVFRNKVRKLEDSNRGLTDRLAEKLPADWEEKFEYWMTNNQYINKATTDIIIDHIKRYILPVKTDPPAIYLPEGWHETMKTWLIKAKWQKINVAEDTTNIIGEFFKQYKKAE